MKKHYTAKFKEYVQEAKQGLPDFQNDFLKIAKHFGYCFSGSAQTQKEVTDFLYAQIAHTLKANSDCFDKNIFNKIEAQLIIDEIVNGEEIEGIFSVAGIILDATRQVEICDIDDNDKWLKACSLALGYKCLGVHDPYSSIHVIKIKEINTANAIKYFKNINIEIKTLDSIAEDKDEVLKQISKKIHCAAKNLGWKAIEYINDDLRRYYSKSDQRFLLQRHTGTYPISRKPSVPYGYLLNITLQYVGRSPSKRRDHKKSWQSFLEMATNFAAIYKIEPYSSWESVHISGSDLISFMQKSILFDHVFMFRQWPLKYSKEFFAYCLDMGTDTAENYQKKYGITQEDVLSFFVYFSLCLSTNDKTFYLVKQMTLLQNQCLIASEIMEKALQLFSVIPHELNQLYNLPTDYTASELDSHPLYKIGSDEYLAINSSLFAAQFFERYVALLRECDKQADKKIGDNLEIYLSKKLLERNINHFCGEKYLINAEMRGYLGVTREDAECDLIIETDKTIFFCEIKKKYLTRASASGDDLSILKDVADSLFASQAQIGNHEAIIRKYGKIKFVSGKSIQLNSRDIQRVSISLFDFTAFQDQTVIDNLFTLIDAKLSINGADKKQQNTLDKIQESISKLNKQYSLDCMQQHYIDNQRPFSNIRYFSVFQILTILENCSSNDDFEREINVTRSFSDGSSNWYNQYKRMRKNKNLHKITPKLNGAILHS